jgi:FG-GAP-like repeat/ASPIC and UnbV
MAKKKSQSPLSGNASIIACVVIVGAGAALAWWWKQGASAAVPSLEVSADAAAEFGLLAQRLFATPGGLYERERSSTIRNTIAGAESDVGKVGAIRSELVQALLREGKTSEAVEEADKLMAFLGRVPGALERQAPPHLIRGLACLRLAEVENCISRHNGDCCVFPLKGGGVHTEKLPAEQAAASFADFLAIEPEHFGVQWLLNIAHMAQGTYPASVPPKFLIPTRAPTETADFPRFAEIAASCGITSRNHAGGVIVDDLDGDGVLDIMTSNSFPAAPLVELHAKGDGTFEDVAARAGVKGQLGGLNLVATDYDNDGDIDVYVLRGGWMLDEGRIRKSLLRNDGHGNFTDVTREAGVASPAFPTQVGVWLDYDNDGDLDLFVGNESRVDLTGVDPDPEADYPCNLFRNEGNGTFTDAAKSAGVTNDRYCKGAAAGDYDNDGWVDLYVSNIGPNRLYRNKGDGTFEDVAPKLRLTEPAGRSFATWFFDCDNDGNLDLWVGAYDTDVFDLAAWYVGRPYKANAPRLYRNKGDGTFEDVTRAWKLWRPLEPMGASFGDLDNDGWLDVYLATGSPTYDALMPNVMLRNVGGGHFSDVTEAGGFGNLQKGHGVAFADLDSDGDQDVFNEVGGFFQGDDFYNSLYENPGNENRFVTLKLEGRRSNRLAYGARIKVVVKTPSGERAIHRAVGSVSSFGGNPSRQEIGLGDATAIESVEIWWPASGTRQAVKGVELDSFYRVVEGEASAEKLAPKRFKLGGG